ncbi:sugar transferase, PEP-CTERM/EpsH1 system associated [Thiorhodococcus drewsii AZ1]|uniref:Sugar transferase, PEP-CTERM/EpsH1 system associated n=1 Tax=Thiorhodococcus drewsii AZ1 TaxID=765913 RepID=G2E609_9GAMM|nr:glycosyltransferase [Thiorhodococcus drewsii]EGV28494.1 sugar transferase, PEP-CTERM/EpsH1 system associated [Thiorhodococcus drewsii AZ1]
MHTPLHVCHIIYRLDFGGLEKLLVEMINRIPENALQHTIIVLTESTSIATLIDKPTPIHCLNKSRGQDLSIFPQLFQLLRRIKPQVVHTYNLATLECQCVARLANVRTRIHAEHGRDASDPAGTNRKHRLLRRLVDPCVSHYVGVSRDIADWLTTYIGLSPSKVSVIRNGVDTATYRPGQAQKRSDFRFLNVARLDPVKDQNTLIKACRILAAKHANFRLTIAGDGPARSALTKQVDDDRLQDRVHFAGQVASPLELYQSHDVFVLSSIAEGTPMTVLEAMACGLPVIATQVGGIPALVTPGHSGYLVPARDPVRLAAEMEQYLLAPDSALAHGRHARATALEHLDAHQADQAYLQLYQGYRDLA